MLPQRGEGPLLILLEDQLSGMADLIAVPSTSKDRSENKPRTLD